MSMPYGGNNYRSGYRSRRTPKPIGSLSQDGRARKIGPNQWVWVDSGQPVTAQQWANMRARRRRY